MKKNNSVLSLFVASAMIFGSGVAHADDLKVSGFGAIDLYIINEKEDKQCSDSSGTPASANCKELQFNVPYAEVDFEKKMGSVTVRLDLDFNGTSNNIGNDDVEQMRFDWLLPVGQELGLTLTAGIFNSPVGFEAQDAPDKFQVTNGQLFDMVPSNLAGAQVSAGNEMVGGSLIFANDFRDPVPFATTTVGEENTIGATLSVTPMPALGLSVGYLDSGAETAAAKHEAILNVVLSGTVMPSSDLSLMYALEYVADELDTGMGVTLHAKHGKHGLTLRYDMVDCDNLSSGANGTTCTTGTADEKPTSLTAAFLCSLEENLKLKVEWRQDDPDTAAKKTDAATIQFVALF